MEPVGLQQHNGLRVQMTVQSSTDAYQVHSKHLFQMHCISAKHPLLGFGSAVQAADCCCRFSQMHGCDHCCGACMRLPSSCGCAGSKYAYRVSAGCVWYC
jgi:hypothetical protein